MIYNYFFVILAIGTYAFIYTTINTPYINKDGSYITLLTILMCLFVWLSVENQNAKST